MRAVAVGLVLLYHAGLPFVPGGFIGVDVFFVISGYLITQMLVREVEQTGRVSLVRFYARRAKRLLPAAALVLATTAVLTWVFISTVNWRVFGIDIAASAAYLVNWRLADRSVDYLAEDVGESPVQHFWSLAVEEQFYIVWPLLLLLVAWGVRRYRWQVRRAMAAGLAIVAIPSLAWSIHLTSTSPSVAFFVTTTRLWELAVGALVAIAALRLAHTPRPIAVAGAWIGLLAVLAGSLIVSATTPWPGTAALIPVLGTAAVIAFGPAAAEGGPGLLLRLPPFQWVGKLSYSLYLWHWPILIAATAYWDELTIMQGVAITLVAFIPAWLAYSLVENPVRSLPIMSRAPHLALVAGLGLTTIGVVAGATLVQAATTSKDDQPAGQEAPGAAVLDDNPPKSSDGNSRDSVEWFVPSALEAPNDVPTAYADGCQVGADSATPVICEYGDPDGDIKVAVVGDSKILQWISAIDRIGEQRGWRVRMYTKSACPFTAAVVTVKDRPYDSCADWNQAVLTELLAEPPDLLLTSHRRRTALNDRDDVSGGSSAEAMATGLVERWAELQAVGIDVVVVADTPDSGVDVYECVAESSDSLTECAFDREAAIERSAAPSQRMAVERIEDVAWIDLTDAICPTDQCSPVIGNVLVYRQGSHVTDTYIRSLAPRLDEALSNVWSRSG